MLSSELLRRVKQIEFVTRKMVNDVLTGQYRSHFKGTGVQFSDHRVYTAGDDIRHIDWKVSARTRDVHIKKFEEERELSVLLLIDLSASEELGTKEFQKAEVVAELAAVLAYAATLTGDRVGAILFAGEVEKILPIKKGRSHILRLVRDILAFKPKTRGTNLALAIDQSLNLLKHTGIVFVLSDFRAERYEQGFKRLCKKHDVVALEIGDPLEENFELPFTLPLEDPETGRVQWVDGQSYRFKTWWKSAQSAHRQHLTDLCRKAQAEWLKIETKGDHAEALVRFFQKRQRRLGKR